MRNTVREREPSEPRYPLNSVDNVLKLLLLFRAGHPIRVAEASDALGVARSTAHRLLTTLEYRGFVRQEPQTRAYLVGDALVDLGRSVIREVELERVAIPELTGLVEKLRETAHVAVLRGANTNFIASVESPETLRTASHVGTTFPAHATASGKVLLAALSDDELRKLYAVERIERLRRNTVNSWSELRSALAEVRKHGYATNYEESESGVNAIAVAIRDAAGKVHGALTVTGPSSRFRRDKMALSVRECMRSAERIASLLHNV